MNSVTAVAFRSLSERCDKIRTCFHCWAQSAVHEVSAITYRVHSGLLT